MCQKFHFACETSVVTSRMLVLARYKSLAVSCEGSYFPVPMLQAIEREVLDHETTSGVACSQPAHCSQWVVWSRTYTVIT